MDMNRLILGDQDASNSIINEDYSGLYYTYKDNPSIYYGRPLKDFNSPVPNNIDTWHDGLHKSLPYYGSSLVNPANAQIAYDIYAPDGNNVKMTKYVKITNKSNLANQGWNNDDFFEIQFIDEPSKVIVFWHSFTIRNLWDVIPAGEIIGYVNHNSGHHHAFGYKDGQPWDIRELLLPMPADPIPVPPTPDPVTPPVINISFQIINNGTVNNYISLSDAQSKFEALKLELGAGQELTLNKVINSGSTISTIRLNYYKKEMETPINSTTTVVTTPTTTTVTQTPITQDINLDEKKVNLLITFFADLFSKSTSRKLGITLLFNLIIVYGVYAKYVPVDWYSVLGLALVEVTYMITNILDKNQG